MRKIKMQQHKISNFELNILLILIWFLPFSSWLVSLSGSAWVSLIRDLLVFLLLFLSVKRKLFLNHIPIVIFIFLVYIFLSLTWTDAGLLQGIKGTRLYLTPIMLFVFLMQIKLEDSQLKKIMSTIIFSSSIICLIAVLELFGIKIPLTTAFSGQGSLESVHLVGEVNITRLQSVMAGPNALGLYFLATIGFLTIFIKNKNKFHILLLILYSVILILTFSRSAWIGLLGFVLIVLSQKIKLTLKNLIFVFAFVFLLIYVGIYLSQKSAVWKNIFIHGSSTDLRVEQYERIYSEADQIGLWGRGIGAAGPSTQNRLDGGENYWSENTYLDIFEELGLVGLILFLGIFVSFAKNNINNKKMLAVLFGFCVAGFFINFFTGQAGIFLIFIMMGLVYSQNRLLMSVKI